ncbi:MAG: exopolysaccharide biosynthesis GT4 family glycosyltransferase EpsE [Paracoccus sp. (in: a-proteobacteria)]
MTRRIGFLIPEFPGQTHIFLWRERQALAELGIEAALISTRPAPSQLASHDWAAAARAETAYLTPLGLGAGAGALAEVLRAGPHGWIRALKAVVAAEDVSAKERVQLLAMMLVAGRLNAIARAQGWDHVHVHSCANAANIAMLAERLGGPGYSLTLHGPTLEGYGPNQRLKWRHAAFGTVISRLLQGVLRDRIGTDLPGQLEVAAMGVDMDRIRRSAPYRPAPPDGPFRLFSCGRLNRVKAHDDLLRAVALLRDEGLDVRLEIAGEDEQGGGGYHRELQALIDRMGLADQVTLLGAVSEDRVREGLENAHAFALASLNEGIAVSIMEAMAMEMPVVVTDVGGNSELIDNGTDALLVPPQDPPALAAALRSVLTDPARAERLAHASRAKVAAGFHHRRSAEAIARCLENLPRRR